ncbi:helix-turn-helix transcriptional regulator [Duganella sp. LX47W]|uniref:Helix-turn-helix transcriptional regulator n=1 Tax=Rugamonas apoptosis TaxID=2758570 RepID=A0A7W2F9E3_9BURK|nr:helix-turn-helix transcriptional regulator [Rugamonas apoptosis]
MDGENYHPELLLDRLLSILNITSDVELSRQLGVSAQAISKMRTRRRGVSRMVLVRMHDISGLSIDTLRILLGEPSCAGNEKTVCMGTPI